MQTPSWTDEHSRTISAAAPPVQAADSIEVDRIWLRIAEGMHDQPLSRRRRTRLFLGAGIAAALLTVGGVAAAGGFSARTGQYPVDAEDLRLGGPGERLDPAAPDYGNVIDEITQDIPFPDQRARVLSRDAQVRVDGRSAPGETGISTGAVRFWTARAAVCAWGNEWAAATRSGDASAKARATEMLDDAPTWPAVIDVDPEQRLGDPVRMTYVHPNGKTYTTTAYNNTEAAYFPLVRAAAHRDGVAPLGKVLARWGACDEALMPDFLQTIPREMRSQ